MIDSEIDDIDIALIGATAICWAGAFALAIWYGISVLRRQWFACTIPCADSP